MLYVKICTLYGDGFYYVPGTDTCLKLGGYVRVQSEYNAGGGGVPDGGRSAASSSRRCTTGCAPTTWTTASAARCRSMFATRPTTARCGPTSASASTRPRRPTRRAAPCSGTAPSSSGPGFTIGKAQSFYDTVTYGGAYSYHNVRTVSDTGASGWNVWAYTAHFGNGCSGTVSLEDPNRDHRVIDNTLHPFVRSPSRS